MPKKVRITNIHNSLRYPGHIYAYLVEDDTDIICISSTLSYIFDRLTENKEYYECVNAKEEFPGEWTII